MIPAGVRFWLAVAVFGAAAAAGYGLSTDDLTGAFILSGLSAVAFFVGLVHVGIKDGTVVSPEAGDTGDLAPSPPPVPPTAPAAWPVLGALAAGITLVGLVAGPALVIIGLALGLVVALEWLVQGWAEHATSDPEENRRLRNRLMLPFEIPVLTAVGAGAVVILFSRVLLALPKTGSTVVAIAVASLVLAAGTVLAARPQIPSGLVTTVAVLAGVALIGGGIAGAVAGEREFHPHEEGHGGESGREVEIVARDIAFELTEIEAAAGETLEIVLENEDDGIQHNIAFVDLGDEAATAVEQGPVSQHLTLTAPVEPGDYTYLCQVHPTQMRGTLTVTEG